MENKFSPHRWSDAWAPTGCTTSLPKPQLTRTYQRLAKPILHWVPLEFTATFFISPLIVSEMFEACVLPARLYGCENWILTAPLLEPLKRFQAEIAKRILMLPPYHSNLGARAVISWPSMTLRILLRKLRFLTRLLSPDNSSISATIFRSLRNQNPGPLIVQQHLFLEQKFGTSCTSDILSAKSPPSMRIIKKQLSNADSILLWDKLKDRNHLRYLNKTSL